MTTTKTDRDPADGLTPEERVARAIREEEEIDRREDERTWPALRQRIEKPV